VSTLIHFRCDDPSHLAAPPRHGRGGIVIRHGTTAYCDGDVMDERHRWVATGGVPLETLIREAAQLRLGEDGHDDAHARAWDLSHEVGRARSFAGYR
jgi:hypothetical protein